MMIKDELLLFWDFLKQHKKIKIHFFLLLGILTITPTQNYYAQLKLSHSKPVIREVEFKLPEISLYPVNITGQPAPSLTALSVLVVDVPSKTIILAKNPNWKLPPASTTKIMTALVALDHWQLNDVLEVKTSYNIGQTIGLEEGEKITLENLLYGLLVQSGNDAAYTLAENYPGGVEKFIETMNKKAKELNLWYSDFKNPTGVDGYGHLTTVHDLAILASEAIKNETFVKIVATHKITISDQNQQIYHELENINQLVGKVLGVKGVKTGWTETAGECLVAYTKRDKGEIITIVLGSNNRFGETQNLIEWVFDNFSWQPTNATPK